MYVIARTARRRPTLMHKLSEDSGRRTACGVVLEGWSTAYFQQYIPQVLCMRCAVHTSIREANQNGQAK